ncbi:hypothetical protein H2200_002369 [Cladophialophora chaetospira]|uniref:C6 zinc finger domain protein n=1 Tax=Cladophialophora chaetospira TaxID=386627 RepID=A0AA38XIZ6_9EURO|nr:hypothetical protein H2200_002369 [Cladophialophora chaetospira]
MAQYNRAIAALAADSSLSIEAILRGQSPHIHVKAGLDLGRSQPQSAWKEQSIKGTALRAFVWFAHLLSAYYDVMNPPENAPLLVYAFRTSDVPRSFSNAPSAIECVEALLRSVMHLRNDEIDLMSRTKHNQLVDYHSKVSAAIDASVALAPKQSDLIHDLEMLRIHLRVISLMLATYAADSESVWNHYTADFEMILTGVENAMAYQELNPRSFYPSLGLVSPLFCVATKSRDPKLQQRALYLLHKLKRKERTWNSCIAHQIARAVFNLEHGFAFKQGNQEIPEDCRVRLDSVVFEHQHQRIVVFYRRMATYKTHPEVESVTVPWDPLIDVHFDFVHMSRKALACFGYTGVHLIVPPIPCQCHPSLGQFSPAASDPSSEMSLELR